MFKRLILEGGTRWFFSTKVHLSSEVIFISNSFRREFAFFLKLAFPRDYFWKLSGYAITPPHLSKNSSWWGHFNANKIRSLPLGQTFIISHSRGGLFKEFENCPFEKIKKSKTPLGIAFSIILKIAIFDITHDKNKINVFSTKTRSWWEHFFFSISRW